MQLNFIILLVAAFIPLVIGFIWYNPKVFGNACMQAAGITQDSMKGFNMAVIFALTFLFSFFIAVTLNFITIHQWGLFSILANEPGLNDPASVAGDLYKAMTDNYGNNFHTFKHGVFHGILSGILFTLPLIAINALFEHRGSKYISLHSGFWTVCLALMGGSVCAFS